MSRTGHINIFDPDNWGIDVAGALDPLGLSVLDAPLRPSAILFDGWWPIPLFAVQQLSLTSKYSLPEIGHSGLRAIVDNSDDDVSLGALLIGDLRFLFKQFLELWADSSARGNGLTLVSTLTVKLDMRITSLRFAVNARRRDAIEVTIVLKHVPRPGPIDLLVDALATSIMTTSEVFGTVAGALGA